ncbi:hypothetical protein AGABI2DRAFT_208124 [Agaricus bisporus var. bisporus H97]|uniref:hypothetical protein n=1 Tax=Agaricus bisporus var. bisporus (strain H97 / ATCC MYA-4626 / FGSC 10389) TaxID=936046 RepID=UPI00029F4FA8|nr:hypothetical protein AGABI2DRAFT_208124 [Agaricus bisporus var. bisporus H97]EKV45238.1 hypothetical protein AGABI2DRAFT_208124 [Agaricus bisporus var. bisporus H97]
MGWLSPPDRREFTLILFCLVLYILAYNLETSLQLLGVDSVATSGAVFSRLGLGKTRAIGSDGRKPVGWRDDLELDIYGDWQWDEGHIAGNGEERTQGVDAGRHGAMWISRKDAGEVLSKAFGEVPVDEALQRWGTDVPQTKVQKHVPGYTILDNVFIYNGNVYLVTDDSNNFPAVSAIVSSTGPGFGEWNLLTTKQAVDLFGEFGGVIRGVSWMAADNTPHNSTLLSLWRTYSSLDPAIDSEGRTRLAPPHRLILPHHTFFTDPDPEILDDVRRRRRVDTGFHPYLLKTAFPQLTVMYFEDFDDYAKMKVPFVFERLVIADRKAASDSLEPSQPAFSPPFELDTTAASEFWLEPVRRPLEMFFDLGDEDVGMRKKKRVVTYIVTQDNEDGKNAKLRKEDHEKLVSGLKRMERNMGCEVNIVSDDTARTSWVERMGAILRSSVVIGVHGDHLLDFAFMKRTPHATFMEFYPKAKFVRDRAVIATSLGQHYIVWSGTQKFTARNLPGVVRPQVDEVVEIDVDAVVKSVQQVIAKI